MDNSSYQPIVLHLDDNHDVIEVTVEAVVRPITVQLGPFLSWEQITDKPASFAPESHHHETSDIDGFAEALDKKLDDAPIDGKQYARRLRSWELVDGLPDQAGHDNKALVTDGTTASWQVQTGGSGGGGSGDVEEAPQDGKLYFRHNGEWKAVEDTFLETTPVGISALWDGSTTPPAGWLERNGDEIFESEYPELYALYKDKVTAGKAFLPDDRGEFLRGWDNGRGVDADRELGSHQDDEMGSHAHAVSIAVNNTKLDLVAFGTSAEIDVIRGQYHDLGTGDTAEGTEQWMLTSVEGGTETRSRNNAVMIIIKAIAGPNLVSQIAVPQRSVYSAIIGQQTFDHTYEVNRPISVYMGGLKLIKGIDFTADTGTSISMNAPLVADADIEIESLGKLLLSGQTDVSDLTGQVNTLSSDLTQVQADIGTVNSSLAQVQTDAGTVSSSLTQVQTDVATVSSDLTQVQTDIATASTGLTQVQTDVDTLETNLTNTEIGLATAGNDISQLQTDTTDLTNSLTALTPRVATLENATPPPDLTDAITALTARVEALENQSPTEPPADEDDDMKLITTVSESGVQEIVCDTGFDDALYSGYLLVISNLSIELDNVETAQIGVHFWNGYSWGAFGDTSVIQTVGTTGAMQDEYVGNALIQGDSSGFWLSGTMTIAMSGSSKGSWVANINTGASSPYRSAMLSAPIAHTVFGIKFYTDAVTPNAMSAQFSIYGYKK